MGDTAERKQRAEEKAIILRNDLLTESGEDPKTKLGKGFQKHDASRCDSEDTKLTLANVKKFDDDQGENAPQISRTVRHKDSIDSSVAVTAGGDFGGASLPPSSATPSVRNDHRSPPKRSPLGQKEND